MPYTTEKQCVTDERIIGYLNSVTDDGVTDFSADEDNRWLYSFMSRNDISKEDFIRFYGFKTISDEPQVEIEFSEEDFNSVEPDMVCYKDRIGSIEYLYAKNPLLGSYILTNQELHTLNNYSKSYVDKLARNSNYEISLRNKMAITLSIVNYVKEWDTEDESGFWTYVTTQFGYKDENGVLQNKLSAIVKETLTKNNRLFLKTGQIYKASLMIHGFATKRSWMYFCDFLFDFYKNNLDWEYIDNDPMVARMILVLRNKLLNKENIEDSGIELGSKITYFRDGIEKLVINRPKFATKLVSSMIKRIDELINNEDNPATCYEEVLCDTWMKNKLEHIAEKDTRRRKSEKRFVAIDYTKIKPIYRLNNEKNIEIVFPDVRLTEESVNKVQMILYCNDRIIEQKTCAYYGNEFGFTLSGFKLSMEDYLMKSGSDEFNPKIVILCNDKEIFNSGSTLFRKMLLFNNTNEVQISNVEYGCYYVFTTNKNIVKFSNSETSEIMNNSFITGKYVVLNKDFIINLNNELVAFDNQHSGEINITVSNNIDGVSYVLNGERYGVNSNECIVSIIVPEKECEKKYKIKLNNGVLDFDKLICDSDSYPREYKLKLNNQTLNKYHITLLDLETSRVVFKNSFICIKNIKYIFNREYYFSINDYNNAKLKVSVDNSEARDYMFLQEDSYVSIPYLDGELQINIPLLKVVDNEHVEWNGNNKCWIKDVPQEKYLYTKLPSGVKADIFIDDKPLCEEEYNKFALGNTLAGYSEMDNVKWLTINLKVNGKKSKNIYEIGKISVKEQFIGNPEFEYKDGKLLWNKGYGFIGDNEDEFTISLFEDTVYEKSISLDINSDVICDNLDVPIGEYKYSIYKESGNIFDISMKKIISGSIYVGDINELRFINKKIKIEAITLEEENKTSIVDIQPSYIDHIEFKGIQYVDSEQRYCPVYNGTMYFIGKHGHRNEYSFEEGKDTKGNVLYAMNPIRIIYINENVLSLVHETGDPEDPGDGFYYYRFYDRLADKNKFSMTDREPDRFNRNRYYLADLYSYTREEEDKDV